MLAFKPKFVGIQNTRPFPLIRQFRLSKVTITVLAFIEHLLHARHCPKHFTSINSFNLHNNCGLTDNVSPILQISHTASEQLEPVPYGKVDRCYKRFIFKSRTKCLYFHSFCFIKCQGIFHHCKDFLDFNTECPYISVYWSTGEFIRNKSYQKDLKTVRQLNLIAR